MKTIGKWLLDRVGYNENVVKGNTVVGHSSEDVFGVELELEDGKFLDVIDRLNKPDCLWAHRDEGSLRNGIELVFKSGYSGSKLIEALDQLPGILHESEYRPTARCGFHLHVSMCEKTMPELANWLLMYILSERQFIKATGNRISSNFCVPLTDTSSETVQKIYTSLKACMMVQLSHDFRYQALNLASLFKFGTVELRFMGATDNVNDILKAIDGVKLINEAAKHENNFLEAVIRTSSIEEINSLCYTREYDQIGLAFAQAILAK